MDSELDSLDDFLAPTADADGAARKFKPKPRGRPRPRSSAVPLPSTVSMPGNTLADVAHLSPPSAPDSAGDSNIADEPPLRELINQGDVISTKPPIVSQEVANTGDGGSKYVFFDDLSVNGVELCKTSALEPRPNTAEPTSVLWDPFDDIDLGQPKSTAKDGKKFEPKLKSCTMKQTLHSAKSDMTNAVMENNDEIFSNGSDSNQQKRLSVANVCGINDVPGDALEKGVPLDDSLRVEFQTSSFDVAQDVQFNVVTDEGFSTQSRSRPDLSLYNNKGDFLVDTSRESYSYDSGEIPNSTLIAKHGNPLFMSVNLGSNTCGSSLDQSVLGVTENQLRMCNMDPVTSRPSNIDCGKKDPENTGLSDLPDGPSIFLPADDYFPVNEHSTHGSEICLAGVSLAADDVHVETAPEIPAERVEDSAPAVRTGTRKPLRAPRKRKARSAQPSVAVDGKNDGLHGELRSDSVDDSVPAEGTGTQKPSKVPRKRKSRSIQPSEAVDRENDGLHGEVHSDYALGQDASKDNNEGDANLKKKGVKRSRKSDPDSVQTKSRKKVNDTSSEQHVKPKKKFTRRTRKQVATLLATPDDEIDHAVVPLRDLILRAEYQERDSKKLPTPPCPPAVKERTPDPSPYEEPQYEFYANDSDQHEEHDDTGNEVQFQVAPSYFNYHSHMDKTPRVAWSTLDTELFFEGIRQFGTDFTLIQQLFPGRTRNQIKSKYKKEERQQPKRITEAIENRANGVSHFQKVIEQLEAAEAQAQKDQELSDELNGAEANEENVQEETEELNDNDSTRLDENDVVVKDDAEGIDTTDVHESENMDDDDYDNGYEWDYY